MRYVCRTGTRKSLTSGGERRRVALCRLLLETRHAAARRTDQPPDAESVARLNASCTTSRAPWAVTHTDRYFLDNVVQADPRTWDRGEGIPWKATTPPRLEKDQLFGAGSFTRSGAS